MSPDSQNFQAKAKRLFSSIEQTMQSANAMSAQVTAVKQTLDALLNALADDFVKFCPYIRLLYRSASTGSSHQQPGVAFRFGVPLRRDCQYDLRIQVKRPDDLFVAANCSDYRQKHHLTVYQGAIDVQKITTALEESLLGWLEWIEQSLT